MGTLRWFGTAHRGMVYETTLKARTPVGQHCVWCDKDILPDDDGFWDAGGFVHHRACLLDALGLTP